MATLGDIKSGNSKWEKSEKRRKRKTDRRVGSWRKCILVYLCQVCKGLIPQGTRHWVVISHPCSDRTREDHYCSRECEEAGKQ